MRGVSSHTHLASFAQRELYPVMDGPPGSVSSGFLARSALGGHRRTAGQRLVERHPRAIGNGSLRGRDRRMVLDGVNRHTAGEQRHKRQQPNH